MHTTFQPLDVVEIIRQAVVLVAVLACPVLAVSWVIGLLSGFFQAMTQIQDHSISFVAKLLAVLITLSVLMPWLLEKLADYSTEIFSQPFGG
jgi:flagellar biosynthetic protein FliQ